MTCQAGSGDDLPKHGQNLTLAACAKPDVLLADLGLSARTSFARFFLNIHMSLMG